MNIQNIASLAKMLTTIGFNEDIGHRLLQHICFRPADFILTERLVKGKDILTFSIFFERKGNEYDCIYYDASFLKEMEMPDLTVHSINVRELDNCMAEIEWNIHNRPTGLFNLNNEASWQREKQIEKIIVDLARLSVSEEGKHFADCLKLKYWSGIPLNATRGNLNSLKLKFEVSQRFYLFDGQGISIEEAYRFLLNRWLEKNLFAKRKHGGNMPLGDTGKSETGSDKSLLHKKRRSKANKIKR